MALQTVNSSDPVATLAPSRLAPAGAAVPAVPALSEMSRLLPPPALPAAPGVLPLPPLLPPAPLVPATLLPEPPPAAFAGRAEATAPQPAANPAPLSRGLAQLLNACVLDAGFRTAFLAAPLRAAVDAARRPGETFGCPLPDPALQVAGVQLDDADRAFLRRLPPMASLKDFAGYLARPASPAGWQDKAA